MNWTLIALVVACCLVTVSAALVLGRSDSVEAKISVQQQKNPPPPPPPPPAPVPPAIEAPKSDNTAGDQLVQLNGITILHQRVPLLDMGYHTDRYYLVPGAHFPGLQGLRLDDAVRLVMTSFPTLTVRALRIGEPLSYEFRRDRLTIQYDSFTKRVVSARIG